MINNFYDETVDPHANKLFLACYAYLRSPWFSLCCEIGSALYKSTVLPIKAALGIDDFRRKESEFRSWSGMKIFFSELCTRLTAAGEQKPGMSGSELLEAAVAGSVLAGLKHQLEYMSFYEDDSIVDEVVNKIDEAPLTNSGCESNFAQFDLECRRGSGQTMLKTISDRHMVKENKYFETDEWKNMSSELKSKQWSFARTSKEAKIVKEMKNKFMDKVKAAEGLANKERVRKKQLKNEKCLKLLDDVKQHGGPLTPSDVDKLKGLTDAQVLIEIKYLHQTVA